ncbi:MAG TPA: hypothetical protein DDZ53_09945 [Firmicutes bacterium]|jgi:hypothetical protein|nr:hypothetical protein [Bacillota bacterium]
MIFFSPTEGQLSLEELMQTLANYVLEQPEAKYKLIIGTDSQTTAQSTHFVTAIVAHRVGKGGRFFIRHQHQRPMFSLRQKLIHETALSLETITKVQAELLAHDLLFNYDLEVHVDAGHRGATRELIRDLVGLVITSGFTAKVKPDSFAASSVADRFTR